MDQKNGYGAYRWADGRVYVGNWINGEKDELRVYIFPNGEIKKAKWEGEKKGPYQEVTEEEKT